MSLKNKILISKVLVFLIFTIFINIDLYSVINCNGAGGVYDCGEESGDSRTHSISIEYYIVEGGGYYLKANSAIQKLLQMVEWQEMHGIDYNELQHALDKAIRNMHYAIFTYQQLIYIAEATPYNEEVLQKLAEFDYPAFMEENRLNPYIFRDVEGYLKYGDITGIFRRNYLSFIEMVSRLYLIDAGISQTSLPGIDVFRELNEIAANVSIFGSYTARVFSNI